jgi:site-specific recombinase XerD
MTKTISTGLPLAPKLSQKERVLACLQMWIGSMSESTVKGYRDSLTLFATWARGKYGLGVNPDTGRALQWFVELNHGEANQYALEYRNWLEKDQKYAPTTTGTHLAALRSFVKAANVVDVCPGVLQIKGPKAEVTRDTRGPNPDEVDKLRKAAQSQRKEKAVRDVAILWLLFNIGLRRFEVAGLDLASVNGLEIKFKGKKRKTPEIFKLSTQCRKYLDDWIKIRGKEPGPLFLNCDPAKKGNGRLSTQGVYNLVVSLAKKAGLKHITPHMLRHSSATELYEDTKDVVAVSKFLRHKNVSTTQIYLDSGNEVQGQFAEKLGEIHKE